MAQRRLQFMAENEDSWRLFDQSSLVDCFLPFEKDVRKTESAQ